MYSTERKFDNIMMYVSKTDISLRIYNVLLNDFNKFLFANFFIVTNINNILNLFKAYNRYNIIRCGLFLVKKKLVSKVS